jgi:hypothetical protein
LLQAKTAEGDSITKFRKTVNHYNDMVDTEAQMKEKFFAPGKRLSFARIDPFEMKQLLNANRYGALFDRSKRTEVVLETIEALKANVVKIEARSAQVKKQARRVVTRMNKRDSNSDVVVYNRKDLRQGK